MVFRLGWPGLTAIRGNGLLLPYICLLFSGFSNVCHFACVWSIALKLGCITNFDRLFLVMGFISSVNEIQFMQISSRHISNRSLKRLFLLFKVLTFRFVSLNDTIFV